MAGIDPAERILKELRDAYLQLAAQRGMNRSGRADTESPEVSSHAARPASWHESIRQSGYGKQQHRHRRQPQVAWHESIRQSGYGKDRVWPPSPAAPGGMNRSGRADTESCRRQRGVLLLLVAGIDPAERILKEAGDRAPGAALRWHESIRQSGYGKSESACNRSSFPEWHESIRQSGYGKSEMTFMRAPPATWHESIRQSGYGKTTARGVGGVVRGVAGIDPAERILKGFVGTHDGYRKNVAGIDPAERILKASAPVRAWRWRW